MQLTRIVIHGFKSFADRVELALEPGLTGVVGPNGCGKSNIVDALRWVSGEASARGVRGDDMDDVIFAGAGTRPGRELADVMVIVEGDLSDYARHATDGVAEVRRTITRGHGSTFRIAGREVRARDVQRLFQDAGAGARGTAIVAQGQVQAVIEARPEDRRRFLEEAAGVGGLQSRKREAESKLLQTEGNLARVADLIGALQARVDQLTRQAAQAERYRKVAHDLREAEAALALARLLDAGRRLENARLAAIEADEAAELADQAHAAHRKETEAAEAAALAARVRLAELVPRHAALVERVTARRHEAEQAGAAAQDLAHRRDKSERGRATAGEQAAAALAERDLLWREDAAAKAAEQDGASRLPGLHEAAAIHARELAAAEAAALAARERRFEHEATVARIRDRQDLAATALARSETEVAAAARRLAGLIPPEENRKTHELRDRQARLEAQLAAAEVAQPDAAARLAAADAVLAKLAAERDALASALPALERRHVELAERRQRLDRRDAALADRRHALQRQGEELAQGRRDLGERPDERVQSAAEALREAAERLAGGEAELAAARAAAAEAETVRAESLAAATAATAGLAQREQERLDLIQMLPQVRADEVMAAIGISEELAAPLAAALGEGLTASLDERAPRHWCNGSAAAAALPAELEHLPSLAAKVSVPPALSGALSMVWLSEAADAPAFQRHLPAGGALVSLDGGLWRWDGYVRLPGATDATALLLAQRERLNRLSASIEADRPAVAELERARQAAEQSVLARRGEVGLHERALAQARDAHAAAERALAGAHAAADGWQRRLVQLDEATARWCSLQAALEQDQAEADAERTGLADAAGSARELQVHQDRQAHLLVELRQAEAARQAAAEHVSSLAGNLARWRQDIAALAVQIREADARFQDERTQIAAERAAAEAQAARHAQDLARHRDEHRRAAEEQAVATTLLDEVRAAALAAEKELVQARDQAGRAQQAHADAATELRLLQERTVHRAQRLEWLDAEHARMAGAIEDAGRQVADLTARAGRADAEARRLQGEAQALLQEEVAQAAAVQALEAATVAAEQFLQERRQALVVAERAERAAALRDAEARTARQAAEAALAALREELADRFADNPLPEPDVAAADAPIPELEERARRLRSSRDRLGAVNLLAAEEAAEARLELERVHAERGELEEAARRLQKAVRALDGEARQRLLDQFAVVQRHFEDLFIRLFSGGHARLRLTDPVDPLRGGLELEASPPGKKLTSLSLMSGGEKAMTALCLIFAFFLAHPSPLCVLDEVDAPLDDANVGRLIDLVQEIAVRTGTRFLVVTHHPLTMARMDRLYGVTMIERGVSRLVSVELGRALELRRTA